MAEEVQPELLSEGLSSPSDECSWQTCFSSIHLGSTDHLAHCAASRQAWAQSM